MIQLGSMVYTRGAGSGYPNKIGFNAEVSDCHKREQSRVAGLFFYFI
jgi:hypothetical protein